MSLFSLMDIGCSEIRSLFPDVYVQSWFWFILNDGESYQLRHFPHKYIDLKDS